MNWFFLLAGILLVFLTVAHVMWGERFLFPELNESALSAETKTGLYVPWHQISILLFFMGGALLIMAFRPGLTGGRPLSVFILLQVIANFLLFFLVVLRRGQRELFQRSIPQVVLFSALIALIALGIWMG